MFLPPIQGGSGDMQHLGQAGQQLGFVCRSMRKKRHTNRRQCHITWCTSNRWVWCGMKGGEMLVAPRQTACRHNRVVLCCTQAQHYAHAHQQEQCVERCLVLVEEEQGSAPVGTEQQWSSQSAVHTQAVTRHRVA